GHHVNVDLVRAPCFLEQLEIFWVGLETLHNSVERMRHLQRIRDRSFGLLFEAGGTAIPELQSVVRRIDDCRGMAVPVFFPTPNETLWSSEKANSVAWQDAQEIVPSTESAGS